MPMLYAARTARSPAAAMGHRSAQQGMASSAGSMRLPELSQPTAGSTRASPSSPRVPQDAWLPCVLASRARPTPCSDDLEDWLPTDLALRQGWNADRAGENENRAKTASID
eukprot:1022003-Pyramimonas_sp.AAC.1